MIFLRDWECLILLFLKLLFLLYFLLELLLLYSCFFTCLPSKVQVLQRSHCVCCISHHIRRQNIVDILLSYNLHCFIDIIGGMSSALQKVQRISFGLIVSDIEQVIRSLLLLRLCTSAGIELEVEAGGCPSSACSGSTAACSIEVKLCRLVLRLLFFLF